MPRRRAAPGMRFGGHRHLCYRMRRMNSIVEGQKSGFELERRDKTSVCSSALHDAISRW
jgi:hypothetical protein